MKRAGRNKKMYSPTIQKLIDLFSEFPTIGSRTASRFVFYLAKLSNEEIEALTGAILNLKKNVKICKFCFNFFESPGNASDNNKELCQICSNNSRDKTLLCVIEKEMDLPPIEKTNKYRGLYFILGGTLSSLKKDDIKKMRFSEMEERIKNPANFGISTEFKEIIIATNPTAEGTAAALYLERILKPLNLKISRLARGLPAGGELEYADEETLSAALEGRK